MPPEKEIPSINCYIGGDDNYKAKIIFDAWTIDTATKVMEKLSKKALIPRKNYYFGHEQKQDGLKQLKKTGWPC